MIFVAACAATASPKRGIWQHWDLSSVCRSALGSLQQLKLRLSATIINKVQQSSTGSLSRNILALLAHALATSTT